MNKFNFKCSHCSNSYSDESMDSNCESECPKCGTWNLGEEKTKPKSIKQRETKERTAKHKPFKKGEVVGKLIFFQGSSTSSFGDKVDKIGKVLMLEDNSTNEYDPVTGDEVTNYIPGFTSKIVHKEELIRLIKNKETTFEGSQSELKKLLK